MDAQSLRKASTKTAAAHRIVVPEHLPLLDLPLQCKDVDRVVRRLGALHAVCAASYGFPAARATAWLHTQGLADELTREERSFLNGAQPGSPFQVQVECLWSMSWYISLPGADLDFWQPCNPGFVMMLPDLKRDEPLTRIAGAARPRSLDDLAAMLDLAFCLHWAARDAAVRGRRPPGNLQLIDVQERRRALEWIASDCPWDDVPMDT